MHRMKEGVIPRVLAKESLNLELQLQRYGEKKFRDLFVISGKWLGVFLEIFLKICGLRVDFGKDEGPKCKVLGNGFF
jgi:hypothetical protein